MLGPRNPIFQLKPFGLSHLLKLCTFILGQISTEALIELPRSATYNLADPSNLTRDGRLRNMARARTQIMIWMNVFDSQGVVQTENLHGKVDLVHEG